MGRLTNSSVLSVVVLGGGEIKQGSSITWQCITSATTKPHVELTCMKDGEVVLTSTTGMYPDYAWPWTQTTALSSPSWTSGGASAIATMYMLSMKGSKVVKTVLATLNFEVVE